MLSLALIANPFARILKTRPHLKVGLENLVKQINGEFFLTSNASELKATLEYLLHKKVSTIAILGGDGSINLVLNAINEIYENTKPPKILILGGGTANVLALNLGMKRSPIKVMADFVKVNNSNIPPPEIHLPCMQINEHIGFVFANGIATRFLETFYEKKGHLLKAGILVARTAFGALPIKKISKLFNNDNIYEELTQTHPMRISCKPTISLISHSEMQDVSMIYASVLPKMGFGIPLFNKITLDDKSMGILISGVCGNTFIRESLRILQGRSPKSQNVVIKKITSTEIAMPTYPMYTIDGEIFSAPQTGVTITIGRKFTFITRYYELQ